MGQSRWSSLLIPACLGVALVTAAGLGGVGRPDPADDEVRLGPDGFALPSKRPAILPDGRPSPEPLPSDAPIAACFDEKNPPSGEVMARVLAFMEASKSQSDYYTGSRWSGSSAGSPITITWSLVPDGLNIPGGIGEPAAASSLFSGMDSKFASQGGRATWIARITNCFQRWSEISGINFQRVTSGGNDWDDGSAWGTAGNDTTRGDMRISMHPIDGAGGVLAYCSFPQNGDMVLDSGDNWGSSTNLHRFLRNTVAHEMGHGIGINHVCSTNAAFLMEPILSTAFDGPQQDDIRAGQKHYGDINEDNNTAGTATVAGNLSPSSTITLGAVPAPITGTAPANSSTLSIDTNGDVDYYSFTTTVPVLVSATATPVGTTYDNSSQQSGGTCNTGNQYDAKAVAPLGVTMYGPFGNVQYADSSTATPGTTVSLSNVLISPGGTYFVRVYETGTATASQLYSLSIQSSAATTLTASDGTQSGFVRLNWTSIPSAVDYRVYRGTTSDFNAASQIATVAAGLTQYDDATAVSAQVYFYWVRAGLTLPTGGTDYRDVANPNTGFAGGCSAPGFTQQPSGATRCVGQGVTFTAAATGAGTTYQWRKDGSNIGGATSTSYTIVSVTLADQASYDCVATASCGTPATSNPAVLSVNEAPSVTTDPTDETVRVGESVSLGVAATGSGLTYQWRLNAVDISGATADTYSIAAATIADAGQYDCVVTSACGSDTSAAATLTVLCKADYNGDTSVDDFDFFDFLNDFNANAIAADYNGDTSVDDFDFFDFLNDFNTPCP
ncbi:MAG: matrixin family metalloprotease [Phycisphaerae bacterium]|nr:matrixin family metalloprotease [Phycisphaerae bacterium]